MHKLNNLIFKDHSRTITLNVPWELGNFKKVENYARTENLLKRDEIHITLIGFPTGRMIPESKFGEIKKMAGEIEWNFKSKVEFMFLSKKYPSSEVRCSIVEMVELTGLEEFYEKFNQLLGINISVPIPHITLYTNSSFDENKMQGIGFTTKEDLERMKVRRIQL
jgi:2'-5' RNA ligase